MKEMAKESKREESEAEREAGRSRSAARCRMHSAKETPRLKERFQKEIAPALMKEFDLKNPMAVPHLHKIVINMGMGEATQNAKLMDPAVNELGQITGQKPVTTRAKKSIAAFKVREGHANRRDGYAARRPHVRIFDRLVSVVLPRVRDFRGVSTKSFDGRGNYTLGLARPVDLSGNRLFARVDKPKGMNVTIVTTAAN